MTIRTSVIRGMARAAYHGGLMRPIVRGATLLHAQPKVPILTFHRVNDDNDPFLPALPTAVFAERMAHIAQYYQVHTVEDLAGRLLEGRLPRNALAITFDDGFRDNLTHAAPILKRLGLPATVFLVTGHIDTPHPLWADRLALGFKSATVRQVELSDGRVLALGTVSERLAALKETFAHLRRVADEHRVGAVEALLTTLRPSPERPKRLMLSWDEVDALRGLGFSIGAHTVSHPILSRVTPEKAREEIFGSKLAIEKFTGETVRGFAYPNGRRDDYNETAIQLVREAGFTCAVTTQRGLNDIHTPVLELRRGGPWEVDLPTYAMKLAYYRATGA